MVSEHIHVQLHVNAAFNFTRATFKAKTHPANLGFEPKANPSCPRCGFVVAVFWGMLGFLHAAQQNKASEMFLHGA